MSRTLHPALGMMSSFNNTVWWFIYGGVPSAFFARYGLGPFLRTVGDMSGSSTMTAGATRSSARRARSIAGTILIVVLCAIFSRSLRLYFRLQNALFLVAMASIVLSIVVFVAKSHGDVVSAINSTFGSGSVKGALKAGSPQGSLDLRNTILPMTWLYLELVFNQSSAYIGGEVRRASRVQLWSMPAAAVARPRRAHAAHLGGDALDRIHALERARQRFRRQPGPVLDAGLQRDRRGRQRLARSSAS